MNRWIETIKLEAARQSGALGQPRHAVVTSVDVTTHAVKVRIQPEGLETGWIPDGAVASQGLRIVCPAEIGTQVLIVPVEGDAEHPIVVARIFDTMTCPPVSPATGRPVAAGEIGIFFDNGTFCHLAKDGFHLKGQLFVDGSIQVTGDVQAADISLMNHLHGGVSAGNALSGAARSSDG
jgi:phage baseplate assembly protein gpV